MAKKKVKLIFQKDYYYFTRELLPIILVLCAVAGVLFLISREIYTEGCFQSYKLRLDNTYITHQQCRELFTK